MAARNGLAVVRLVSQLATGQAIVNSFHISKPALGSPPTYDQLFQLATDIQAYLSPTYRPLLLTDSTFQKVEVEQVIDPNAPAVPLKAVYNLNAAGTRTTSNPRTPQSLCAVLSFGTPNASRRFRGHLFLPPALDNGQVNGDSFTSGGTYIVNCNGFAAAIGGGRAPSPTWTGTELASWFLALYSRKADQLALAPVANVQSVNVRLQAHWLRSRERGSS